MHCEDLWDSFKFELSYKWRQIRGFFNDVKYFLYNCWVYIPILWSDRDWDETYIYQLLRFKLAKQRKYITQHGHSVAKVIKQQEKSLTICINLLDRLIEKNYVDSMYAKHEEKWGQLYLFTDEGTRREDAGLFCRENVTTDEQREQEYKEFRKIVEHEEYMIQQDLSYLTTMLRKHIRMWWD